jgi:hypothetical protein
MESTDHNAGEDALAPDVDGEDAELWAQPLIEYWIWTGTRLIPASANKADRLREIEAFQRLELWKNEQERDRRREDWHQRRIAISTKLSAFVARFQRRLSGVAGTARRKTPSALSGLARHREMPYERRSEHAG